MKINLTQFKKHKIRWIEFYEDTARVCVYRNEDGVYLEGHKDLDFKAPIDWSMRGIGNYRGKRFSVRRIRFLDDLLPILSMVESVTFHWCDMGARATLRLNNGALIRTTEGIDVWCQEIEEDITATLSAMETDLCNT